MYDDDYYCMYYDYDNWWCMGEEGMGGVWYGDSFDYSWEEIYNYYEADDASVFA